MNKRAVFSLKPKKGDLAAVLFVLVCIVICVVFLGASKTEGNCAEVFLHGEKIAVLPLDRNCEFQVKGEHTALIKVENGKVFVSDSDCPTKDCVRSGKISKGGQSIVCLPGEMVIKITGDGLDAVVG